MFSVLLGMYLRSGIAGSQGSFVFNLLINCQTVFQNDCTILCPNQSYSNFSTNSPSFVIVVIFIRHPSGCEMTSRCVLIFISLMINDVEHLLIYFLAVRIECLLWRHVPLLEEVVFTLLLFIL